MVIILGKITDRIIMPEKILLNLDKKLKKIIPGFLENRHREITEINSAIQSKKYEKLNDIGHQLKGSAGSYGFMTLSQLGGDLEEAGKEKNIQKAQLVVEKISDHLKHLEIDFD